MDPMGNESLSQIGWEILRLRWLCWLFWLMLATVMSKWAARMAIFSTRWRAHEKLLGVEHQQFVSLKFLNCWFCEIRVPVEMTSTSPKPICLNQILSHHIPVRRFTPHFSGCGLLVVWPWGPEASPQIWHRFYHRSDILWTPMGFPYLVWGKSSHQPYLGLRFFL